MCVICIQTIEGKHLQRYRLFLAGNSLIFYFSLLPLGSLTIPIIYGVRLHNFADSPKELPAEQARVEPCQSAPKILLYKCTPAPKQAKFGFSTLMRESAISGLLCYSVLDWDRDVAGQLSFSTWVNPGSSVYSHIIHTTFGSLNATNINT